MYNILYLNDLINYYDVKKNKIFKFTPYLNSVRNGIITDVKKFSNCFKKMLKINNIKSGILYDKLIIITPPNFNNALKYIYKEIFNNLNYKFVIFKSELDLYNLSKKNININVNDSYFYYTDTSSKTSSKVFDIKDLHLLNYLIDKEKNVYIYGNNYSTLVKFFDKNNINYYYFEDNENYFINKVK